VSDKSAKILVRVRLVDDPRTEVGEDVRVGVCVAPWNVSFTLYLAERRRPVLITSGLVKNRAKSCHRYDDNFANGEAYCNPVVEQPLHFCYFSPFFRSSILKLYIA